MCVDRDFRILHVKILWLDISVIYSLFFSIIKIYLVCRESNILGAIAKSTNEWFYYKIIFLRRCNISLTRKYFKNSVGIAAMTNWSGKISFAIVLLLFEGKKLETISLCMIFSVDFLYWDEVNTTYDLTFPWFIHCFFQHESFASTLNVESKVYKWMILLQNYLSTPMKYIINKKIF
jgi:hypothetical protein